MTRFTHIRIFLLVFLTSVLSSHAEKALDVSGVSIPFSFDNYDEYMEIGSVNQVQAFWFKRALGSSYAFLLEGGNPYETVVVDVVGDFVVGNTETVSINDNDWHHVMLVTRTNSRTDTRLSDTQWIKVSYNVDIEYYIDNQLVKTTSDVTLTDRYVYKDNSLVDGGSGTAPPAVSPTFFTLGGHAGFLDDYVVVNDLTDAEILDLYRRGANTIASNDPRVKVYWADEETFVDIDHFSNSSVTIQERIVESDRPVLVHLVSIQSDYGDDQFFIDVLDPDTLQVLERLEGPIEFARIGVGNIANISAPEFVYLDRYGAELEPTPENIRDFAYYRRVNDGYTAPGATIDGTSPIAIKLTVDKDVSIGWSWRDEVAVFLDSATENFDELGAGDGGLQVNGVNAVPGKIWVTPGSTEVTAQIDKSISPGGANGNVRFAIKAVSEENSSNHSADHYLVFDGSDDYVQYDENVIMPNAPSVTFEFWARRDNVDSSSEQEVIRVSDGASTLRVGFSASPGYESGGMFLADADTNGIVAQIDGTFIDDYWHHWAWSYDGSNQVMTVYRDGEVISEIPSVNLSSSFTTGQLDYKYYRGFGAQPTLSTGSFSGSDVYEANEPQGSLGPNASYSSGNARLDNDGEYIEWTITNSSASVFQRWLQIRYRGDDTSSLIGGNEDQNLTVTLNGATVISHNQFDGNNSWRARQALVTLQPGSNVIRATASSISSDERVDVDEIRIYKGSNSPTVADAFSLWGNPVASGRMTGLSISSADQLDFFGFSWKGGLWVETSGTHQFSTTSDDGSVLKINGAVVVNNDGSHGSRTRGGSVSLSSGLHEVELDYYNLTEGGSLSANWNGGGELTQQFVPVGSSVFLGGSGSGRPFQGELNNVRIWGKSMAEAEVEVAMMTAVYAGSDPMVLFEESFETQALTTTFSSRGYAGTLENFETNFSAEFSSDEEKIGVIFPSIDYSQDPTGGTSVSTQAVVANDWLRLGFNWTREYKIQVATTPVGLAALPFVTVDDVSYEGSELEALWIEEFSEVTVGTRYRTSDRCFTLKEIRGQLDEFESVTMSTLLDGTFDNVATRQFSVAILDDPGSLVFEFDRTIFRAEVPLGEALDISTLATLNAHLVPNLCEGGELSTEPAGPTVSNVNFSQGPAIDDAVQWDSVGERLWPAAPGQVTLEWPDANDPAVLYQIELVSGFPTEIEQISWQRETEAGYREGSHPDYVTEVTNRRCFGCFSWVSDFKL